MADPKPKGHFLNDSTGQEASIPIQISVNRPLHGRRSIPVNQRYDNSTHMDTSGR